ncbi:hypothetical protein EDD77_1086 [Allofournierella massiliensis]|uniref:Uncharacterized protein n=1 Tax=Allofournierella massiliensis TaxID=1650663 RepID=A0A4R1QYU5_9FIRM|nr:hypothetical protein EDD77_1086 [Fournierella massiliensis]
MRTQKTFAELRCRMIRENINQRNWLKLPVLRMPP